jgi:hypothetical protein
LSSCSSRWLQQQQQQQGPVSFEKHSITAVCYQLKSTTQSVQVSLMLSCADCRLSSPEAVCTYSPRHPDKPTGRQTDTKALEQQSNKQLVVDAALTSATQRGRACLTSSCAQWSHSQAASVWYLCAHCTSLRHTVLSRSALPAKLEASPARQ